MRAARKLSFDDARTTEVAFRALAAEIAAAGPEPFLMLRTIRLSPEHPEQLAATLHELSEQPEHGSDQPRYGMVLGLCRPADGASSTEPGQPVGTDPVPPTG